MIAVRNPHLLVRLLRKKAKPAPPRDGLRLLGRSIDAIVQCTRRYGATWLERLIYPSGWNTRDLPIKPDAGERIKRYNDALQWYPAADHDLRQVRGVEVQKSVKRHPRRKVTNIDTARFVRRWG